MPVPPLVTVHPLGICKLKSAVSYSSSSTDLAAVGVTAISSFDEDKASSEGGVSGSVSEGWVSNLESEEI